MNFLTEQKRILCHYDAVNIVYFNNNIKFLSNGKKKDITFNI